MKTKTELTVRHKPIQNIPASSEQVEVLNDLLHSIIVVVQDQSKVNSALAVRVLSLEAKVMLLHGRLEIAKALGVGY
jgi:hypothetical protein